MIGYLFHFFCSENFQQVWDKTSVHKNIPFNFDSHFIHRYFGREKEHALDYFGFIELLQVCEGGVHVCEDVC